MTRAFDAALISLTAKTHGRIQCLSSISAKRTTLGLISADHTGAPESMRGTGAAAALVSFMVEDARQNGFKVIPLCPYVRAQYAKHPEWADVFTTRPGEAP